MMLIQKLVIFGERQSGKSSLLIREAIEDARNGRVVLYHTENAQMARVRLDDACAVLGRYGDAVLRWSDRRIDFPAGGYILFRSQANDGRGLHVDTHIIDSATVEDHPTATRIVKAVLA